ncbi:(deoxy)nucleoside triphosphate pyrophosphohydrolase [Arthrobacter sp. UM1]|uniref:(deoxy)nucleoside triphosphate pyrophosphohydrolase n=1 Tax=Arthrobacter sp. UM1 TaxID=2766776 RepID=UPI001CF61D65|nr:NUDIX domain-containing protein [Arthrobacter sp. UM1]MCB4208125.1 NUDIX domain-containing protein [Arthrobacter sp. UM1]
MTDDAQGSPSSGAGTVIVAAAVVEGDRFLAARRTYPPTLAGQWEFPGGKVEPGEDLHTALVRECREELGVPIELGPEVLPAETEGPWAGWPLASGLRMRVFEAALAEGASPASVRIGAGHDDVVWAPLGPEAHELAWIEADRPIVDALVRQRAAR